MTTATNTCICFHPKPHYLLVCSTCWAAVPAELRQEYVDRCVKKYVPSWYSARHAIMKWLERAQVQKREAERAGVFK